MYMMLQGCVTGVSHLVWHITESFLEEVMFGLWPKGYVEFNSRTKLAFQAGMTAGVAGAQRVRGSRVEEEGEEESWGQTIHKALLPQVGRVDLTQEQGEAARGRSDVSFRKGGDDALM